MLIIRYLKINALYKTSAVLALVAVSVPVINSLGNGFLELEDFLFQLRAYFDWSVWQGNGGTLGNKIAIWSLLFLAVAFFISGTVLATIHIRNKKKHE